MYTFENSEGEILRGKQRLVEIVYNGFYIFYPRSTH